MPINGNSLFSYIGESSKDSRHYGWEKSEGRLTNLSQHSHRGHPVIAAAPEGRDTLFEDNISQRWNAIPV